MAQGAAAGLHLDPVQAADVEVVMARGADGKWAAQLVVIVEARQNGKGAELEVIEVHHLRHVPTSSLIIHSAHEMATSAEGFLRLQSLIDECPDLKRLVPKGGIHKAHGKEGIDFRPTDGQPPKRIRFKTRSTGSGRGFSADLVILDEGYDLAEAAISAMAPTMSARLDPQLIVTSSHPFPHDHERGERSKPLRRLMRIGRAGAERMAYIEYRAPDGADLDDPAAWAMANPGFPHRISAEAIEAERVLMTDDDFRRERLGIVDIEDPEDDGGWSVIVEKEWARCTSQASRIEGPATIALDVSPDRKWSSFVAAGKSSQGGVHVELANRADGTGGRLPGTGFTVVRAAELYGKWGTPIVLAKGSPAWSLEPELTANGIEVVAVETIEHSQACGSMVDAIADRQLHHTGDPVLTAAAKAAEKRPYGDAWLWSRSKSAADISPLVAATLARWVAIKPQPSSAAVFGWDAVLAEEAPA